MQIKEHVGDMQTEERVVARPVRPPQAGGATCSGPPGTSSGSDR